MLMARGAAGRILVHLSDLTNLGERESQLGRPPKDYTKAVDPRVLTGGWPSCSDNHLDPAV